MTNSMIRLLLLLLPFSFAGCGKTKDERVYKFNGTLTVDGRVRTYLLNLPPNYDDTSGLALVVALHGTGGNASQCERDYKWSQKANTSGFIVVYPEGVKSDGVLGIRTWNAGTCCHYAQENNINDVKYISTLIDHLVSTYKIDPKSVYVTGMSNGAMLAYRLACELAGKIAAIAPVSGTLLTTTPCNPLRAVPVLHIHSVLDTKVPYQGGTGLAGYYFPPVDSALQVWAAIDACSPTPQVVVDNEGYTLSRWFSCSQGTTIERYLTKDGGHSWPGGIKSRDQADDPSVAMDATDVIWDFFQRYKLH